MKGKERHEMRMCRFSLNIRKKNKQWDLCTSRFRGIYRTTGTAEMPRFPRDTVSGSLARQTQLQLSCQATYTTFPISFYVVLDYQQQHALFPIST